MDDKIFIDDNGAPRVPQSFLMARRLVEAGCRVVTVNYSKWDWHGGSYNTIFNREREDFPILDNALSTLMDDLRDRGLEDDVTVLVWGEFGRTPIISQQVGRDHWPRAMNVLLSGGGLKMGQVVGATNPRGEEPTRRAMDSNCLLATIYRRFGIDPHHEFRDLSGRPFPILKNGEPIAELL